MSVARYRERHVTSGAKSDPGDARALADMVRTDAHRHRPIAGDTELAEAIKVLARSHQSLCWMRGQQANQLRSTLREFYPAALTAFDQLTSTDALAVLAIAPAPARARRLTRTQITAALRRGGRRRYLDRRTEEIHAALHTEQLEQAPLVADAFGASVAALVAVLSASIRDRGSASRALPAGRPRPGGASGESDSESGDGGDVTPSARISRATSSSPTKRHAIAPRQASPMKAQVDPPDPSRAAVPKSMAAYTR